MTLDKIEPVKRRIMKRQLRSDSVPPSTPLRAAGLDKTPLTVAWLGLTTLLLAVALLGGAPTEANALAPTSSTGGTVPWKIVDDTLIINCQSQEGASVSGEWRTSQTFDGETTQSPWHDCAYTSVKFETITRPKVTDFLFYESQATAFDFTNLDTSSVTSMKSMFAGNVNVAELDLRTLYVGKNITIDNMFGGMTNLQNIFCNDAWPVTGQTIFEGDDMLWSRTNGKIVGNTFSGGGNKTTAMANPTTGYFTSMPYELSVPIRLTLEGSAGETLEDVGRYFDFEFTSSVPDASSFEVISLDYDTGLMKIGAFAKGCYRWSDSGLSLTVTVKQKEPTTETDTPNKNYMAAWTSGYDRRTYQLRVKLDRWKLTSDEAITTGSTGAPVTELAFTNTYETPSTGTFQMSGIKQVGSGRVLTGLWRYRVKPVSEVKMMADGAVDGAWIATNTEASITFPAINLTRGGTFSWSVTELPNSDVNNSDSRSWLVVAEVGAINTSGHPVYEAYAVHYYRDDMSENTLSAPRCEFGYEKVNMTLKQSVKSPSETLPTWVEAGDGETVYFTFEARQSSLVGKQVDVTIPPELVVDDGSLPDDAVLDETKTHLTWTVTKDRVLEWTATATLPVGRDVVTTTAQVSNAGLPLASGSIDTVVTGSIAEPQDGQAAPYDEALGRLDAAGATPTETLRAAGERGYAGAQKNYQVSATPIGDRSDSAMASYLTKSASWESRDGGTAAVDLEGAMLKTSESKGSIPVYIFTVCTSHNFSREIAEGNINHLLNMYGIVAVKSIDQRGIVSDDKLFYRLKSRDNSETIVKTNDSEITTMMDGLYFQSNCHYSNCVAPALREHIFGSITTPLDEASIVHDPIAIYCSFDNIAITSDYIIAHVPVNQDHIDLWPICEAEWFHFVYNRYVTPQNRYFAMSQSSGDSKAANDLRPIYMEMLRTHRLKESSASALGLAGLMAPENYGKVGAYKAPYSYTQSFDVIFTDHQDWDLTIRDTVSDWLAISSVTATYQGAAVPKEAIVVNGQSVTVTVQHYDSANPTPVTVHIAAVLREDPVEEPEGWRDTNGTAATLVSANAVVESVASPILSLARGSAPEISASFTPQVIKRVVDEDGEFEDAWPFEESPFTFTLVAEAGAPAPSSTEATTDGNGVATWPAVTYGEAGEYRYTIAETPGDVDDIRYDEATHEFVVTVDDVGALTGTWDGTPFRIDGEGRPVSASVDGTETAPTIVNVKESPMLLPDAGGEPSRALAVAGVLTVTAALAGLGWVGMRRRPMG